MSYPVFTWDYPVPQQFEGITCGPLAFVRKAQENSEWLKEHERYHAKSWWRWFGATAFVGLALAPLGPSELMHIYAAVLALWACMIKELTLAIWPDFREDEELSAYEAAFALVPTGGDVAYLQDNWESIYGQPLSTYGHYRLDLIAAAIKGA